MERTRILVLQTGGTIDKDYPRGKGSYAFEITEPAAKRVLGAVNPNFDYEIRSVLRKDSLDMTQRDRRLLYDVCSRSDADKILITHGTDTMVKTARALSLIKGKLIVLTGSLLPERFVGSDAAFNIGTAIGAMNVLTEGVYIAMSGRIYAANNVVKANNGQFVERKRA